MRSVVYARYSTDLQSFASVEDQIRICRERIDREGWTFLHAYHDRAMSGASRLRPAYQKLLDDARKGVFDIVVAEALDRLSRDQEDIAHLYKQLCFSGVRLVTLSEGPISEIHIGLSGTMGALYLKQLAEKTHRGLRGRVEAGQSGGGNSYGYEVVQRESGHRTINLRQADIIRRIFKDYAHGLAPRSIAKTLNREGVPGPRGGTWSPSAINGNATRGTGILNNELYIGRLVWNRLKYVKNPNTGRRQSRSNPREVHIVKDVPGLRIVPQALWDAVKARQREMARNTRPDQGKQHFWKNQRPRYLLSGLLKCGLCGASYTKAGASRFGCAGARDRATCSNHLSIRGDDLEAAILSGLKARLMDPTLFEEFTREFTAEINRQRLAASAAGAALQSRIERIEGQIRRLVDAIIGGADAKPINDRLKELEAERGRLIGEREKVPEERPLLHPNLAAVYRRHVEELGAALRDPDHGREAFEFIRRLIEEVRLVPMDGELSIELKGQLAGILALAEGLPKPAPAPRRKRCKSRWLRGLATKFLHSPATSPACPRFPIEYFALPCKHPDLGIA